MKWLIIDLASFFMLISWVDYMLLKSVLCEISQEGLWLFWCALQNQVCVHQRLQQQPALRRLVILGQVRCNGSIEV